MGRRHTSTVRGVAALAVLLGGGASGSELASRLFGGAPETEPAQAAAAAEPPLVFVGDRHHEQQPREQSLADEAGVCWVEATNVAEASWSTARNAAAQPTLQDLLRPNAVSRQPALLIHGETGLANAATPAESRVASPSDPILGRLTPVLRTEETSETISWRRPFDDASADNDPPKGGPRRVSLFDRVQIAQAKPLPAAPLLKGPKNGGSSRPEEVAAPGTAAATPKPTAPAADTSRLGKPLVAVVIDTTPEPTLVEQMGKTPENFKIKNLATSEFGDWAAAGEEVSRRPPRAAVGASIAWAAPSVYHRPLYFEQPNLERYGHETRLGKRHGYGLPSAISAAHFFGTIPALPYLIGAEAASCRCDYVLGAYRPGSCNPHRLVVPPINLRGALYEAAAATGLAFFVP